MVGDGSLVLYFITFVKKKESRLNTPPYTYTKKTIKQNNAEKH